MRTTTLAALLLVLSTPLAAQAQTVPEAAAQPATAQQYVTRLELQKVADAPAQDANGMMAMASDMLKKMLLPDGPVEMTTTTDGQSVRAETRGRWMTMPSGAIVLMRAGDKNLGYVLNPAEKTYYALKLPEFPMLPPDMPKPEVGVKASGVFETIAGHRAERVDVSWRIAIPVPEGVEVPPGVPTEIGFQLDLWCAQDIKLRSPRNLANMEAAGAISAMMPGKAVDDLTKSCSFPLKERLRFSVMPEYEIRSTVTSIAEVPSSPDLFAIPAGYKEVPTPEFKFPGIGGTATP